MNNLLTIEAYKQIGFAIYTFLKKIVAIYIYVNIIVIFNKNANHSKKQWKKLTNMFCYLKIKKTCLLKVSHKARLTYFLLLDFRVGFDEPKKKEWTRSNFTVFDLGHTNNMIWTNPPR